jgi:hypothetical protein
MWRSLNRTFDEEEMSDALARARRFRTRAQEFHELAETCGSAQYAKHYYLIAKHYLALAHLDEEKILTAPRETQPTLAPESESESRPQP